MNEMRASDCIAQMVWNAAVNDDRAGNEKPKDVLERARLWYDRLCGVAANGRCYYADVARKPFDEFLCETESNMGILDFWDGDVITDDKGRTGIVKYISVECTIRGGGYAKVIYPTGKTENVGWKYMKHAVLPAEFLAIAKAQLLNSCPEVCPLRKED